MGGGGAKVRVSKRQLEVFVFVVSCFVFLVGTNKFLF